MEIRMAFISNNNVNIYYEDHGRKNRTTLLLSHGYGGSSEDWKNQVDAFKEKNRIIAWDMRGHGRSDSPSDLSQYSIELTISDMEFVLDECGVEKAVLVGMSMGGYMTLSFNMKNSNRVKGLILCGTGPGFKKDEARENWNNIAYKQAEKLEKKIANNSVKQCEKIVNTKSSLLGLVNSARGMLAQKDSSVFFSLPEISVPTLIVVGSKDDLFLRAADSMEAKIKHSRKVIIQDADHYVNIDGKDEFNSIVNGFLNDL